MNILGFHVRSQIGAQGAHLHVNTHTCVCKTIHQKSENSEEKCLQVLSNFVKNTSRAMFTRDNRKKSELFELTLHV